MIVDPFSEVEVGKTLLSACKVPWDNELQQGALVAFCSASDDQFGLFKRGRKLRKVNLHNTTVNSRHQLLYKQNKGQSKEPRSGNFSEINAHQKIMSEPCHIQRVEHELSPSLKLHRWRQDSTIKHLSQRFPLPFSSTYNAATLVTSRMHCTHIP